MRLATAMTVLILAAGCATDSETGPSQSTTTPSAAAGVPEEMQGSFEREVTDGDNEAAGAAYGGGSRGEIPLGNATMLIEPDGLVFTTHADGGDEELVFVVTGDRVKVTGGDYCPDPTAPSTYRWSRSDDTLVVTPIDNDCPDRQALLAGSWRAK